ncbi:hypothetical protein [Streptomyces sp. PT19]|uniref:hypothetical protein n=1 Tax=Streptomyces sp. PT19 TaxID=3452239 RepID=UPI003F7DCA8E
MFEIRVITDPAEPDRVSAVLSTAFATGQVRQYPTRDGRRTRLYVTADHRPEPGAWPQRTRRTRSPPSIIREIGDGSRRRPTTSRLAKTLAVSEFWLRKAALLDRIALRDHGATGDAVEAVTEAARHPSPASTATRKPRTRANLKSL